MRNKNNKVIAYSFKIKQQTTVLILLQISDPASGVVRYQYTRFFPHKDTNLPNNRKIFDTEYPKLLWNRLPVPNKWFFGSLRPQTVQSFKMEKSSRVQPPPPLRKNRRRGIWGERATVHRLEKKRDVVNHRLTTRKSKARAARGVWGHTRFENFEMLKLALKRHF